MHHLKNIFYALLLWIALAIYPTSPAIAGSSCGSLKQVLKKELSNGYALLAFAETSRHLTIIFLINRNGNWEIVGTQDGISACIVAKGTQWSFVMERAI